MSFVDDLQGLRDFVSLIKNRYGSSHQNSGYITTGEMVEFVDRTETVLLSALDVFVDVVVNGLPYPPDKLTGVLDGAEIDLEWIAAMGDVDNQRVYRDEDGGGFAALVPDIGAGDTTYTDSTVSAGHTYSYYIVGVNVNGESDPSNTVVVDYPSP